MLSASWGSPLIVDGKVYIGDEDGDVAIFRHSADPKVAMKDEGGDMKPFYGEINMGNSVYSTPIVADNVLYIANRTHLFAIDERRRSSRGEPDTRKRKQMERRTRRPNLCPPTKLTSSSSLCDSDGSRFNESSMPKRVLDVGQCGPDHATIRSYLTRNFDCEVVQVARCGRRARAA